MDEEMFECVSCQHRQDSDEDCEECEEPTIPVKVSPCPNGVTAADWRNDTVNDRCNDDSHEWKTGEHVVPVGA